MLSYFKHKLPYHRKAMQHSLSTLMRKPFATLTTVLVVAITLSLPVLFWIIMSNMDRLTINWQQGDHISLYLQSSLSEANRQSLLSTIKKTAGVEQVILKSAAEGLAELQSQEGMTNLLLDLPENPIPAMIDVTPSKTLTDPEAVQRLFLQLQSLTGVDQAKLDVEWIKRLHALFLFITTLTQGLIVLLCFAVILIIGNTLRLAMQNNLDEIQVLKYIGAPDSYIIRPFLYAGIWYGLAGALVALLLVSCMLYGLNYFGVKQLVAAFQLQFAIKGLSLIQILGLFVLASCLGWLGACLTVKRQLTALESNL